MRVRRSTARAACTATNAPRRKAGRPTRLSWTARALRALRVRPSRPRIPATRARARLPVGRAPRWIAPRRASMDRPRPQQTVCARAGRGDGCAPAATRSGAAASRGPPAPPMSIAPTSRVKCAARRTPARHACRGPALATRSTHRCADVTGNRTATRARPPLQAPASTPSAAALPRRERTRKVRVSCARCSNVGIAPFRGARRRPRLWVRCARMDRELTQRAAPGTVIARRPCHAAPCDDVRSEGTGWIDQSPIG